MPHPTVPVVVGRVSSAEAYFEPLGTWFDVRTYPWAFAPRETGTGVVESVKIETATAAPGEKRSRKS